MLIMMAQTNNGADDQIRAQYNEGQAEYQQWQKQGHHMDNIIVSGGGYQTTERGKTKTAIPVRMAASAVLFSAKSN